MYYHSTFSKIRQSVYIFLDILVMPQGRRNGGHMYIFGEENLHTTVLVPTLSPYRHYFKYP